ncbi:hypothetical protein BDFB_010892, partial [Asbolus verrucosus]
MSMRLVHRRIRSFGFSSYRPILRLSLMAEHRAARLNTRSNGLRCYISWQQVTSSCYPWKSQSSSICPRYPGTCSSSLLKRESLSRYGPQDLIYR